MKTNRRFTLIEIMVVIMIIAGLAAMVVGVVGPVINNMKVQQAKKDMNILTTAFASYQSEYNGAFPVSANSTEIIDPNKGGNLDRYRLLVAILTGDPDYGGQSVNLAEYKRLNRGNKSFMQPAADYRQTDYDLKDPWGNYYVFHIDANGDGKAGNVMNAGDFLVWSYGPSAQDDENKMNEIKKKVTSKIAGGKLDGYIWNGADGIVCSWIETRNVDNEEDDEDN